jgi:hypothetical protein
MKAKRIRRQYQKAIDARLMNNYRQLWADLAALPWRTRVRLAWMMATGERNLDKATKRKEADDGKA